MSDHLVIALDGMGGDNAPDIVIDGAALAKERQPSLKFLIFGDKGKLEKLLEHHPKLKQAVEICHTDLFVSSTDKPSHALRKGKDTSMSLAIQSVRDNVTNAVVSAGNTGALMAIAMFGLRTLTGVSRPAITSYFPTMRGESCMLDLGANLECDARNLVEFSAMGEVFARTVMGIQKPTIGLLNVGVEEMKGKEELRKAAEILRTTDLPIVFQGFVEGDDIGKGSVDVIVTDGFTGNIALKTTEGTAKLINQFLHDNFQSNLLAKIGFLFSYPALKRLKAKVDPRHYNGAVFLGLNGIVVKSHGGTDAYGFAHAIDMAANMARNDFINKMKHDIEALAVKATEA